MRWGARIFGAISGILLLYLLVGFLLPGRWKAEETALLSAPPSRVFPLLDHLTAWEAWTPFPESGLEAFGPASGPGAGIRWQDPRYGKGEARITMTRPDAEVRYEVEVEGGALTIRGVLALAPEGAGTRLRWVEEGDFGWNPLMGFAAREMASSQGEAMRASLARLEEASAGPAPGSREPDSTEGPPGFSSRPGGPEETPNAP